MQKMSDELNGSDEALGLGEPRNRSRFLFLFLRLQAKTAR
jgi:hypothetical protein